MASRTKVQPNPLNKLSNLSKNTHSPKTINKLLIMNLLVLHPSALYASKNPVLFMDPLQQLLNNYGEE